MPGAQAYSDPSSIQAQTKDAFSTAEPHDEYGPHVGRAGDAEDDEYALLHSTESRDGRHPGRPVSWGTASPGLSAGGLGGGVHHNDGYDTPYSGGYSEGNLDGSYAELQPYDDGARDDHAAESQHPDLQTRVPYPEDDEAYQAPLAHEDRF